MCQSSHNKDSTDLASEEVVQKIQNACKFDKVSLGDSAQYHTGKNCWAIGRTGLRSSVENHIEQGRKIHRKYDDAGLLLEMNFHANVTIYEGKDVYVEMVLTERVLVVLNAHEHTMPPNRRLSQ